MDLTKKITACLVALSVGSGIVPQIVYAIEPTAESQQDNLLQYEVTQEANEKKTQSTISLKLSNIDHIQIEKVTLPDGSEYTKDLKTVTYVATVNGQYLFKVDYLANGANQSVTIPVQITELNTLQSEPVQENSLLQYEVAQETNEEKTQATISLQIAQSDPIQLLKVILPDGTEQTEDFSNITYTASKNGPCDFTVVYLMDGIEHNEIISVEITGLVEQTQVVANDELNTKIELKGATYFDGHPFWGTKQKMVSHGNAEVPYNGWQLMELNVEIPYQDGLEVKAVTPTATSQYPELSKLEKDDQNSKWIFPFFFYDNGKYDFTIDYTLAGEAKTTTVSFVVDGLVSIKDIAMRRHLINEYGEFSGLSYQGGQYVTQNILAMTPSVGFFTFGLDGDNGRTAENTTSLDGLQYLTQATGLYLFKCQKLATGETIGPVTQGYYPNMKRFRVSELNQRPQMPSHAYNGELVAECIANMPALEELVMNGVGFSDCTVFRKLTDQKLYYLQAMANNIVSLDGIESQPNLSNVNIGQNQIQSIEQLSNLNQIDLVNLNYNQVFDLKPLNLNLDQDATFAGNYQDITYDRTVISPLQNGVYTVELPMPIDIDGTLTDTSSVDLKFANGTTKAYSTTQSDGKTYISIPEGDVDSNQENPFEDAEFTFSFNNNNGADPRTTGQFNGNLTFKVSPIAKNYHVVYDFVSGTRGKPLPTEVTDLLPIDPTQYEEGQTVNAIQPQQTTVTVEGGTWTFEGYDANSKLANDANVNENGDIPFTGTWTFTKTEPPVTKKYSVDYDFISGTTNQELPQEVVALLPVDPNQYDEGQTVNAIQPTQTTVTVADGTWTFNGYDSDSKVADANQANENGVITFTGTWTFEKSSNPDPENPGPGPDQPDPDKPVDPDQPINPDQPDPDKPVDPDKPIDPDQPTDPEQPVDPEKPTEPNQPTKPEQPSKPDQSNPSQPNKGDSVDTGRRTNLLFSSLLLLVSGICMLGVVGLKAYKFNEKTDKKGR